MNNDIKNAVNELGQAFEMFKGANDQRLAEIEHKGSVDPLTEMKVNRLNDEISRAQEAADMAKSRVDILETSLNRLPVGNAKYDEYAEAHDFVEERKQGHGSNLIQMGISNISLLCVTILEKTMQALMLMKLRH